MSWLLLRPPYRHPPAVRRIGCACAVAAASWACALQPIVVPRAHAAPVLSIDRNAGSTHEPLAGLVAGLLSFTHWPASQSPLRLCIWGSGRGVSGLRGAALGSAQRRVMVLQEIDVAQASQRCDAVYLAAAAPTSARALPTRLAGRPILVIGEGPSFCAEGGMFCVEFGARTLTFQANLDAIARSGLRVDPQALRIGRPGSAPPS